MPSTNWSQSSITSTLYSRFRTGNPIGLLLTLTYPENHKIAQNTTFSKASIVSTDFTPTTKPSTNWS